VYCLEFDSQRIVTGSRDRTIKVWALATGALLGSFRGHNGSVLCLKFERDWDAADARAPGFMVSGSSDCSILVWNLWAAPDGEVHADVRAVLRGHTGGVLDLRMDERSVVSWCAAGSLCVWRGG
jgi:F-box and WD-40 domain protein 1/11